MAGQVCLVTLLHKYFLLAHKENEANGQTVRHLDSVYLWSHGIQNTFRMSVDDLCLCDRQVLPQSSSFRSLDCHLPRTSVTGAMSLGGSAVQVGSKAEGCGQCFRLLSDLRIMFFII